MGFSKRVIIGSWLGYHAASVISLSPVPAPASAFAPTAPAPAVAPNAVATKPIDPSCIPQPLNAVTWNNLKIDNYLANFPNGKNLTLSQYADLKDCTNMRCGIEEICMVGQMCNPVKSLDWYVLFAVEEWNNCMNSVYKAVHYATTTVQGTLALMISGLAEPNMTPSEYAFDAAVLVSLLAGLTAAIALGAFALLGLGFVSFNALLVGAGVATLVGSFLAPVGYALSNLLGLAPVDKKPFIRWGSIGKAFSDWEGDMHSRIINTTQTVINAPISSPEGISGVVKGGNFLFDTLPKSTADLQLQYAGVLQARALVLVLRAMGAYIVRGLHKCDQKGPNGARAGRGELSFCTKDKVSYDIVLARGHKTGTKIHNSDWILARFGFSTEYIVLQSWDCQQTFKQFEYDPYRTGPLPSSPMAICVINLPVCDLSDQKIELARHGKHHHLTTACRVQGHLPI